MAEKSVIQWQYKIEPMNEHPNLLDDIEMQLNQKGKQGWELAGVIQSPELKAIYPKQSDIFFIFKKPA